jgi:ATP-dependent helicase/nuclease subunit B
MNADLLARLEAGATLVTPNRRLAQYLKREFDSAQQSKGLAVWPTPDVLPLSTFIERCFDAALHCADGQLLPVLLTPAQEAVIWEQVVRRSDLSTGLLSLTQTAAQCRAAWQLAHAWHLLPRLRNTPLHEDATVFLDWAGAYEKLCRQEGYADGARLADLVGAGDILARIRKPVQLIVYGFDIKTPQQITLWQGFANAGVNVVEMDHPQREASSRHMAFVSQREEIAACARWTRDRLETNPAARIGVVVPDLARLRERVAGIFTAVLAPANALPGAAARVPVFNLSLGQALSDYPLVHDALNFLEIAGGRTLGLEKISAMIRSPFIAGAERELEPRALLDIELRKNSGAMLTLEHLLRQAEYLASRGTREITCSLFIDRLSRLAKEAQILRNARKPPGDWSREFAGLLAAIGFPGERGLDSSEFQVLGKLREALAALATLERIVPRMRFDDALARLAHIVAEVLFQAEAPDTPVQILGVLESAGLNFDHLWVMGLTEDAWPMAARPNPFIPVVLQRAAGVPESSAALSLQLDQRITRGWQGAAGEVIFSHPLREDDRELLPSPLIGAIAMSEWESLGVKEFSFYRERIHAARTVERFADEMAPAFETGEAAGAGAGVFRDQAACPFRAFARYRLAAATPATPVPGLDAMQRGTLLHDVLAQVWAALGTKARLDGSSAAELDTLLAGAAGAAVARLRRRGVDALEGRFGELEKARLESLVRQWLDIERARGDFEVVAVEDKREVAAGGVRVRVKLDRLDRLPDGSHAIIDYKTGQAKVSGWLGARPDEPQLPLYLLSVSEDIAALAFAKIRIGDMQFEGLGRSGDLIPHVTTIDMSRSKQAGDYASWDELVEGWRREIEALGRGFASGDARVDPKHGRLTCQQCDLQALCRINELNVAVAGDDDE